jgi:hypothetical protein
MDRERPTARAVSGEAVSAVRSMPWRIQGCLPTSRMIQPVQTETMEKGASQTKKVSSPHGPV